ncbi:MAG: aquaporin Z [Planctomycetia bacterium]|nr:aquaporin Z [Planctomycetia bacterium]
MGKLLAEMIGTFWLVLGGCGSAVLAAAYAENPHFGIGFVGVSLAFGLTVLTMAVAIGHISGCHLNPAVTIGLAAGGRFAWKDVLGYVVAQTLGGFFGAFILFVIATGMPGYEVGHFASNGYEEFSPSQYSLLACFVTEVVLTAVFLFVIHGATDKKAGSVIAPIAIGLCLTLIHLVSIPVTNCSVNPARSTATALVAGYFGSAVVKQLWLFWVAPIVGGIIGGVLYRVVDECDD